MKRAAEMIWLLETWDDDPRLGSIVAMASGSIPEWIGYFVKINDTWARNCS